MDQLLNRVREAEKRQYEQLKSMVTDNPVVILHTEGCNQVEGVTAIILEFAHNPKVYQINNGAKNYIRTSLGVPSGNGTYNLPFPAVFIGGKLLGGVEELNACKISGKLEDDLRKAGAIWM